MARNLRRRSLGGWTLLLGAAWLGGGLGTARPPLRDARAAEAPAPSPAPAPSAEEEAKRLADLLARLKADDVDVRRQAFAEALREPSAEVTAAQVKGLTDADEKVRRAAIAGLAQRATPATRKKAAEALAGRLPRLARAEQRNERLEVLGALHDLAQPFTLAALSDGVVFDMEPEELALRLKAIANLPCDAAVDFLVKFRASFGRGGRGGAAYWHRMVREAWIYATGQQDLGNDPDRWRAWWQDRKGSWDHAEALARRRAAGGGPSARAGDDAEGAKDGRRPPPK